MRDYNYITPEGHRIPVAELSTDDINRLLIDGFHIDDAQGASDPVDRVRERLQLELFIRARGL